MNRRGFLGTLVGAAAFTLDPDQALWVRGKKLISIPKPRVVGASAEYKAAFNRFRDQQIDMLERLHPNAFAMVWPRIDYDNACAVGTGLISLLRRA